jgi:hypothetical protein
MIAFLDPEPAVAVLAGKGHAPVDGSCEVTETVLAAGRSYLNYVSRKTSLRCRITMTTAGRGEGLAGPAVALPRRSA